VLKENGFYDVVKPGYDPSKQNKGGLYFDEANEIFTYDVTDIDFDQDVDILDEEGNVIGTDWQAIRKGERGIDIDESVATERAGILAEADRLEAEVNALTSYIEVLQYRIQFFPSEQEVI
jgi:hypothetical protein